MSTHTLVVRAARYLTSQCPSSSSQSCPLAIDDVTLWTGEDSRFVSMWLSLSFFLFPRLPSKYNGRGNQQDEEGPPESLGCLKQLGKHFFQAPDPSRPLSNLLSIQAVLDLIGQLSKIKANAELLKVRELK